MKSWLVAGYSLLYHIGGNSYDVLWGGWDAPLKEGYLHIPVSKIVVSAYVLTPTENKVMHKAYNCKDTDIYELARNIADKAGYTVDYRK